MALPVAQAGALNCATSGLAVLCTVGTPPDTRVYSLKVAVCVAVSPEVKSFAIT